MLIMEHSIRISSVRSITSKEVAELKIKALEFPSGTYLVSQLPHLVSKHYAKINLCVDLSRYCFSGYRYAETLRSMVVQDCVSFVAYCGDFSPLFSSNCVLSAIRYDSSARRFIVNIVLRLLTD